MWQQFSGMEKDEVIPKEWLERMNFHQHDLTSNIEWNVGDVLVIDVSPRTEELYLFMNDVIPGLNC